MTAMKTGERRIEQGPDLFPKRPIRKNTEGSNFT